jgi:hypothetical protein
MNPAPKISQPLADAIAVADWLMSLPQYAVPWEATWALTEAIIIHALDGLKADTATTTAPMEKE